MRADGQESVQPYNARVLQYHDVERPTCQQYTNPLFIAYIDNPSAPVVSSDLFIHILSHHSHPFVIS